MNTSRSQQHSAASPRRVGTLSPSTLSEPTIAGILWRGKWWMLVLLLMGLGGGMTYLKLVTPIYESTAEIYVARREAYRDNSPLDKPALTAASPVTHGEIIRTTEVLATALRQKEVAESLTLAGAKLPLQRLRDLLKIEADLKDEIVRVTCESPYPEEAAMLTNSIVATYLRLQKQRSQIGGWNLVQNDGDDADAQQTGHAPPHVAALAQGTTPSEPENVSTTVIAAQMSRLGEALTQAEVAASDAEVRYRTAMEAGDDLDRLFPLASTVLGTGNDIEGLAGIRIMQNEIAQIRRIIDDLPASWGPSHPKRQELQARFADAQHRYNSNRHAVAQALRELMKQKLEHSRHQTDEIRRALDEQHALAAKASQLPIAVIEPAQVPLKPAKPQSAKVLGLGGILGLFLGVVMAFAQDAWTTQRARTRAAHAAQILASAPPSTALVPIANIHDLPAALDDDTPVLGAVPTVASSRRLASGSPVLDDGAASIHQIRAMLQLLAQHEGKRSFAFTSPERGTGRTSVLVGLGTSLALSGTRTLLVDCDLASRISRGQTGPAPSTSEQNNGHGGTTPIAPTVDGLLMDLGYMGQQESRALTVRTAVKIGIAGMLDGGSLQQCAVPASVPNLTLLPAVFATPLHIGKLSPAFVERLLREAADHYDLVLFDTGPIPGSVEALIVTARTEGVVVIVPPGQSQKSYDRMRSYLKMIGARIIGVIFNRSTPTAISGGAPGSGPGSGPDDTLENLGSGVLAAAVFSDASSAYASDDPDMTELGDVTAGITNATTATSPNGHSNGATREHVANEPINA